jgi:acetolactate synthase-1/3 small subunit
MRHIISVLLENETGALSRVSGLFSQRGFNIESLTVAQTNDPSLSRMTIVSTGNDRVLEQIVKQLNKLIEVVKVSDLTSQDHVERELMLVKVCPTSKDELDIKQLVDIFSCKIVDVTEKTYTIEISGKTKKINAFLNALDSAIIMEVSRTGVTGISRGKKAILK